MIKLICYIGKKCRISEDMLPYIRVSALQGKPGQEIDTAEIPEMIFIVVGQSDRILKA